MKKERERNMQHLSLAAIVVKRVLLFPSLCEPSGTTSWGCLFTWGVLLLVVPNAREILTAIVYFWCNLYPIYYISAPGNGSLNWKKKGYSTPWRKKKSTSLYCVWFIFWTREFGLMARYCINSYPGVGCVTHIALFSLSWLWWRRYADPPIHRFVRCVNLTGILSTFQNDWLLANPVWTTPWPSFLFSPPLKKKNGYRQTSRRFW